MVHVPLIFLSEWRDFFRRLALQEKSVMTARVSMLLKSRASPDMLSFSLCNKKRFAIRHMNRPPLSNDTIDSVLRYRDLVGLRTYQHPLVNWITVVQNSARLLTAEACDRSRGRTHGICNGISVTETFSLLNQRSTNAAYSFVIDDL